MSELPTYDRINIDNGESLLTDEQVKSIISVLHNKSRQNINCKETDKNKIGSSCCLFVSGHGDDLEVNTRNSIVDVVMGIEFKFPMPNGKMKETSYSNILVPSNAYPNKKQFQKAFTEYLEKSVYLQMAMGEPGPSAPMNDSDIKYSTPENPQNIYFYLSSSEIDIALVANAYRLLAETNPAIIPTNCDLMEFNRVIRHQLRANFIKIWDENPKLIENKEQQWMIHYLRLLENTKENPNKPKIWVQKRLNQHSYDRYYQLAPNDGENPDFRVHEGLHIYDLRNEQGVEVPSLVQFNKINSWKETVGKKTGILRASTSSQMTNVELDINNLNNKVFRDSFLKYVETKLSGSRSSTESVKKITAIKGILKSIEKKELYLSEICLLGFLLDIQMLTIWDPACRPLADEKRTIGTTRTGTEFRNQKLTGKEAANFERFLTDMTQPI